MPQERLQKIIAAAGIASRRKAEELITSGLVTVNGQTITQLGARADLATDHIKVGGKLLRGAERHVYLLLHKPKGYVTTLSDPDGRPTVMDLVSRSGARLPHARLYPVGRLDYNTEGLLLLTNDGELANQLTRAASHVPKTYLVKVSGVPTADSLEQLRRGVMIPEERFNAGRNQPRPGRKAPPAKRIKTAPARVRLFREGDNPWFEVTIIEGKNRQLHKMFESVGHRVEKIKRVKYGPLELDVEVGKLRELSIGEVQSLRAAVKPKRRPGT